MTTISVVLLIDIFLKNRPCWRGSPGSFAGTPAVVAKKETPDSKIAPEIGLHCPSPSWGDTACASCGCCIGSRFACRRASYLQGRRVSHIPLQTVDAGAGGKQVVVPFQRNHRPLDRLLGVETPTATAANSDRRWLNLQVHNIFGCQGITKKVTPAVRKNRFICGGYLTRKHAPAVGSM